MEKVKELTITDKKNKYIVYYDIEFNSFEFKVGQNIKVRTSNSFIIYYEVSDEKVSK